MKAVSEILKTFDSDATGFTGNAGQTMSATRDAYSDSGRVGVFNFLPTIDFTNLSSRTGGNNTGDLVITIL